MIINDLYWCLEKVFPYNYCPMQTWDNPMQWMLLHMKPLYISLPDNKKEKRKGEKTKRKNNTSDQINSI